MPQHPKLLQKAKIDNIILNNGAVFVLLETLTFVTLFKN